MAVKESLVWLKEHRGGGGADDDDDEKKHDTRKEVHFFVDSDLTCKLLTEPGVKSTYFDLVQRTRRLAATLIDTHKFIMHWIPSHLNFGFEIRGNAAADKLAADLDKLLDNAGVDARVVNYLCASDCRPPETATNSHAPTSTGVLV